MKWFRRNWFYVALGIVAVMLIGISSGFLYFPRYGRAFDRETPIDPTTGRSAYHEEIMNPRGRMDASMTDLYRQNIIIIENQQRILQQQEAILNLLKEK